MPKLKILIGIPGAGKSTWRKSQTDKVFSSDDYRKELLGDFHQNKNQNIFQKLNSDTFTHLKSGENAIYDTTNISRKKRIELYKQAKKIGANVEAVHFLVPLEEAKRRNKLRNGLEAVPDEVIERMYKNLQVARAGVDCDEISVQGNMEVNWDSFNVPHNNPYHQETVIDHINRTIENSTTEKEKIVSKWHDVGKIDCLVENTKDTEAAKFFRAKNNGKFYQFMLHNNVSAQYYLSHIKNNLTPENLDNLEHILLHDSILSEKIIRNYKLNDDFIKFHDNFRKIDEMSMDPSPYLKEYLEIINKQNKEYEDKKVHNQIKISSKSNFSSQQFHINNKGEVKPCKAKVKTCKYSNHFDDYNNAQIFADNLNKNGE